MIRTLDLVGHRGRPLAVELRGVARQRAIIDSIGFVEGSVLCSCWRLRTEPDGAPALSGSPRGLGVKSSVRERDLDVAAAQVDGRDQCVG
jgi:hypothetical protein